MQLWLTVDEAAPYLGIEPQAIYRAIREDVFPFDFVRIGRKIKISARSIGLITPPWGDFARRQRPQNGATRPQEALAESACDRAVSG